MKSTRQEMETANNAFKDESVKGEMLEELKEDDGDLSSVKS
jgi:hypothetical protein